MRCELKLWLDYSSIGDEPQPIRQDLARLFSSLQEVLPGGRVRQSQYGYIGIPNCSPAEIASAKETATSLHIPIRCRLEEQFSRRELPGVQLALLTLKGDYVGGQAR